MITVAVAAAVLGGWVLTPSAAPRSHRLAGVLPVDVAKASDATGGQEQGHGKRMSPGRSAVAGAAMLVCALFIGGAVGVISGGVAAAVVVLLRPPAKAVLANPDEVAVVVDLLAGCLAAGVELSDALDAAAHAAEFAVGARCRAVAAGLRTGAPPAEVWSSWLTDPSLALVARIAIRTSTSGAATAADLQRAASRIRSRRRAVAQNRVRRASVWLVAPLGLCFLPAFVLVAVAPLVVGLITTLA